MHQIFTYPRDSLGAAVLDSTVAHASSDERQTAPTVGVSFSAQGYIDDICRVADNEACFLCSMGEIHRERIEGGVA